MLGPMFRKDMLLTAWALSCWCWLWVDNRSDACCAKLNVCNNAKIVTILVLLWLPFISSLKLLETIRSWGLILVLSYTMFSCQSCYAQQATKHSTVQEMSVKLESVRLSKECVAYNSFQLSNSGDTINIVDCKGKKQGYWVEQIPHGDFVEMPERAVGSYVNGTRVGQWVVYNGVQLSSSIQYASNYQDGEARFYEDGKLACIGYYKAVHSTTGFDTFAVYNPRTGADTTVAVRASAGLLKNGLWSFYNTATGKVAFTREYWLDELLAYQEMDSTVELSAEEKERLEALLPHQGGKQFAPMQKQNRLQQPPTLKQLKRRL
jgi:hypothetical protein